MNRLVFKFAVAFAILVLVPFFAAGCDKNKGAESASQGAKKEPLRQVPKGGPFPALLMVQAQFDTVTGKDGKARMTPGYAKLTVVREEPGGWKRYVVEDPDSNVYHKAVAYTWKSKPSILTIGANQAKLKAWSLVDGKWSAGTLLTRQYGGKHDRFRDLEIGDVNGDGQDEIVIATHDQGVIEVVSVNGEAVGAVELARNPGTFVHEVEIGDVDGDGKAEFFATPSKPNKSSMVSQPGEVVMFRWDEASGKYVKTVIDTLDETHAKEILAARVDDSGRDTLFAVIEAHTEKRGGQTVIVKPVEIRRYRFEKDGTVEHEVAATLRDRQCRFLMAGDLTGDGKVELVAAAMKSGLWMLRRTDGGWKAEHVDTDSSGYEHASIVADLTGDGKAELYVASDDQGELRRYRWNGSGFDKTVIAPIDNGDITWNLAPARL